MHSRDCSILHCSSYAKISNLEAAPNRTEQLLERRVTSAISSKASGVKAECSTDRLEKENSKEIEATTRQEIVKPKGKEQSTTEETKQEMCIAKRESHYMKAIEASKRSVLLLFQTQFAYTLPNITQLRTHFAHTFSRRSQRI
ncbi:unnamed protein product [Dicrocoelium dendriticum]|nr:unnamed protein product [Dicrocoelium dendriticum]